MLSQTRIAKLGLVCSRLLFAALVAVAAIQSSLAQNAAKPGIISGSVLDAEIGGPVPGARIILVGTDVSVTSDMNGRFIIDNVPVGSQTLIISATYYKSTNVQNLGVVQGEVSKVTVPLYEDSSDIIELEAFTVTAEVLENSQLGLLNKRQKAPSVSDAIGSESFSRLGLSDAADAMSKVTGASIIDGQYVVVRGLSDRYNNATLNGATIPSADPYKKAVQLDQFPSGLIDAITTTKTFTPDKPGDFTGGAIDIQTKSFPDRYFLTVTTGFGFNSDSTGKDYLTYTGGGTDWLGIEDGTRDLPELAKDRENLTRNTPPEIQDEIVRSFSPEVSPRRETAGVDTSFSIATGDSFQVFDRRFGYVASLTYRRKIRSDYGDPENRYRVLETGPFDDRQWTMYPRRELTKDESEVDVSTGFTLNAAYQFTPNNEVGVKSFFSRSGNDSATFISGLFDDSDNFYLRENRLHYTERAVDSVQLYGNHLMTAHGDTLIEWSYSDSSSSQNEPDFRLFYDSVPYEEREDPPAGSYSFPTGLRNWRLFRELSESNTDIGVNVTVPLRLGEVQDAQVKFGFKQVKGNRDYLEETYGYATRSAVPYDGKPENYLSDENIGLGPDGKLRRVITREPTEIPRYLGESKIEARYVMLDVAFTDQWRAIVGARQESTNISVNTYNEKEEQLSNGFGEIVEKDLLPSANLVWSFAEGQNLRVAYSETLARPNYRELSPIKTFTAIGGFLVVGNADLERSLIKNYDVRWELFMNDGQLLAVSVFQKNLEAPIEQTFDFLGRTTYANVDSATVRGIELEARRNLGFLSGEQYVFSVGGNFSVIESEVSLSPEELAAKQVFDPNFSDTRELQGQSPYILNVDCSFEQYRTGTIATLSYNKTGKRLYEVSLAQLPNVDEETGGQLDLIVSQRVSDRWTLKFKAENLLNEKSTRYHDFLGDSYTYSESASGITYGLSATYRFE